MEPGGRISWRSLGRWEKAFVLLLLAYVILRLTGAAPVAQWWLACLCFLLGVVVTFRLARRGLRKAIWRLRNRLIAAYLFIAVVPVVLILMLAGIATWAVIGQMAVYLVNTELRHRQTSLLRSGRGAGAGAGDGIPPAALRRFATVTRSAFPKFELLITGRRELRYPPGNTLTHPPAEWKRASGLIVKQEGAEDQLTPGRTSIENGEEVTILAPVTTDLLGGLVPGLGDVALRARW